MSTSAQLKPSARDPSFILPRGMIIWEDAYPIVEPQTNAEGIHVWPFDHSFPVDVRFFVFGKRRNIRLSRHDYFELLYIESGEVVYQVQDRCFNVNEGDLIVISGAQYHRMKEFHCGQVRAALLYFIPDLIRANDMNGEDVEYLMPFLVQDATFPHVVHSKTTIPAQIFDLMKRIHAELPVTSPRARLSVKTYLKMILVLLVNHYAGYRGTKEIFYRKQSDIERLRPLFEHIDHCFGDAITVEDAASVVCMSKSHFMRFFRQVTGQPFVSHLNHFRIAKAQALLATTDKSISEVSQEVGFCDQSYFGLVFRKLVHMTPREYKEHLKILPEPFVPQAQDVKSPYLPVQ
jgi:AraC family transcriptional regulator, transcriptional activator of pobA